MTDRNRVAPSPLYRATVHPTRRRSFVSGVLLKLASCHAVPLSMPTPGTPPTSTDAVAIAVCGGLFQVTTAVFVRLVLLARPLAICTRNRKSMDCPGCNGPYAVE